MSLSQAWFHFIKHRGELVSCPFILPIMNKTQNCNSFYRAVLDNSISPRCQMVKWFLPPQWTRWSTTGSATPPSVWPTWRTLTTAPGQLTVDLDDIEIDISGCCPRLLWGTFWVPRTFTKSSVTERASLGRCRSDFPHSMIFNKECWDSQHQILHIIISVFISVYCHRTVMIGFSEIFLWKNWLLR